MVQLIKENLWKQFGASIDMLHNAIAMWPDEQWEMKKRFFYIAYHTLVFLEYYLTNPPTEGNQRCTKVGKQDKRRVVEIGKS